MSTDRLPEHMRAAAELWVKRGAPHPETMGGFMRAVLLNDLTGAALNADHTNGRELKAWAAWLYDDCPQAAWGNERKLLEWHEAGGLEGPRR